MSYPLIILGAGASYDFSPLELGKVAPLTNDLVKENFMKHELLEKYPGAGDILSDIILQVKKKNRSFEEVVTEMKERTKNAPIVRAHFVALEFYLKDLFKAISTKENPVITREQFRRMRQVNNYRALMNRINTYSAGKAFITTFNYDTLLEQSIHRKTFGRMRDYMDGDLKLAKLHGSHDWIYIARKSSLGYRGKPEMLDGYHWCMENPDFLENHRLKTDATIYHEFEFGQEVEAPDFVILPALAVPLVGKDRYVCPSEHVQTLQLEMMKVDRVLIVGWKAGDPLLLEHMKQLLPKKGYNVLVVSGTLESAQQIAGDVREKIGASSFQVQARGGGFSGFIEDESSHTFFSQNIVRG